MKKLSLFIVAAAALLFMTCSNPSGGNSSESKETSTNKTQSNTKVDTSSASWAFVSYDMSEFADKTVKIDFSCDMKIINNSDKTANLKWQLTLSDYPVLLSKDFEPGDSGWVSVKSSAQEKEAEYDIGGNTQLYLSTYQLDVSKFEIELKNIKYTVTYKEEANNSTVKNWTDEDVPSLKETYADCFDSFGIACEYSSWNGVKELSEESVRKGLSKHADSITMGNEFKPDSFLFAIGPYSSSKPTLVNFTASNGLTIKVPETLNYTTVDNCLSACKQAGLKMRGHVLVWHSQTPDNFFAKDYAAETDGNLISNMVSKEEMTARQEWYIKSVLQHVADWEAENNDGKHIVWAWDVVNEAMADDSGNSYSGKDQNWLRGSTGNTKDKTPSNGGSRWYQLYGNEEFIVNAFRFANAYAPEDVKLCYNDYNEYMNYSGGYKTDAILHMIDLIKKGEEQLINGSPVKPRIDVMGMQSHVGSSFPKLSDYEGALKKYLEVVDVHVTELDYASSSKAEAKKAYRDIFATLKNYGKKYNGTHHLTNVTVWGINNSTSWIYKDSKYPLLFDKFKTTDSFWAVIEAHDNF